MDFEILGDTVEKGIRKYEVVVATSPKKTIDRYLSLLDKASLKPTAFIPCSYALVKIAEKLYFPHLEAKGKTFCFLAIGESHTEVVILQDKNLVFSRKIPIAG